MATTRHDPRVRHRPLRVIQLINGLGHGGGERLLATLALGLADRVHTDVFCLTRLGPWAQVLRQAGVPVTALTWHGVPLPWSWLRLLRSAIHGNVLHAHFYYSELLAAGLARLTGIRTLATRHEMGDWMGAPHRLGERWALRKIDRVLCVSEAVRNACVARNVPTAKLDVIYPDIATTTACIILDERPRHVVTVGRLEHVKGHDVLLDAWARATSDPSLAGWCLRIVGDGSQRRILERRARSLGISGSCTFVGELSPEGVAHELTHARVFILPSRSEALSLALMEALACGLACVASDTGGVPELIEHDANGLLVSPCDVEELTRALVRLTADLDLTRRIASAARARMQQHLDPARFCDAYAELYVEESRT